MLWGSSIPTTYLNLTWGRIWLFPVSPSCEHHPALRRTSCGRSAHDPKGLRLNSDFVFATEIKILTRGTAVDPGRKWYRLELYPVIWNLHNFRVTIFVSTYTQKWPRGHPCVIAINARRASGAPISRLHPCFLYEEKSTRLPILLCIFSIWLGRPSVQYDISGAARFPTARCWI